MIFRPKSPVNRGVVYRQQYNQPRVIAPRARTFNIKPRSSSKDKYSPSNVRLFKESQNPIYTKTFSKNNLPILASNRTNNSRKNPLSFNVMGKTKRRVNHSYDKSNTSISRISAYNFSNNQDQDNNVYLKFKDLVYEIRKKDFIIKDLEERNSRMILINDPKELNKNDREFKEYNRIKEQESYKIKDLKEKIATMKGELEKVNFYHREKKAMLRKHNNTSKTVEQLQQEFNRVYTEYKAVKGQWGNIVTEDKLKQQQRIQKLMDKTIFDIILEAAKESTNKEAQELYQKLKHRKM